VYDPASSPRAIEGVSDTWLTLVSPPKLPGWGGGVEVLLLLLLLLLLLGIPLLLDLLLLDLLQRGVAPPPLPRGAPHQVKLPPLPITPLKAELDG